MRSESFSRRSSIVTETIKEDEDPANEEAEGGAKETEEKDTKFIRSAPPTPGGPRNGVEEKVPEEEEPKVEQQVVANDQLDN